MGPVDYARLAQRCYTDPPTIGDADSASRLHVYGDVHCFRGTDDIMSWLHDANCAPVNVWGIGRVHSGFWDALSAILPACLALPRPVAITGHSLGAAMAVLYAGVLAHLGHVAPIFAFEPPRMCCDGALALLLKSWKVPFYATRNGNDVVTEIPIGMTLPGKLTRIGTPRLPFANVYDHSIGRVVDALVQPAAVA